ncbi:hypothetical protein VTL71DRAFT_3468 [Oculimacula yallundae]|uniref:Uncharacterized protein n=1 Tax=Oculimacula yallundae TaxID=86028 RepID=A0ABR4C9E7_9HELO
MLSLRRSAIATCFVCLAAFFVALYIQHHHPIPYQYPDFPYGRHIIGIDLGESYSRVGVVRKDVFEIISDSYGHSVIPAYVSFPDYGEALAGSEAQAHASSNSKGTIYDVRSVAYVRCLRLCTVIEQHAADVWWVEKFSDPEVQEAIKDLPYKVVDNNGRIAIQIYTNGEIKVVTPEEVLGITLQHLICPF